ncbi:acyltransferase [Fulvivirga kasyanovii]
MFKSNKVYFKNEGLLIIKGKLYLGFLSNRLAMNPSGKGVFRVYKGGNVLTNGLVRIARTAKIYVSGLLEIGAGTYINPNTIILARKQVKIGKNCAISWNCQILDDDLHFIQTSSGKESSANPIIIEDKVWIGANVIILKGVRIGEGSVIAAGSVVTGNVVPGAVYAGVPAKKIKEISSWG